MTRARGRLRQHHDGERGAVLVLVAIVLSTLIGFTSLAIDIGYQRVVRRDMQAVADVVALDLSRRLDGRTAAVIDADPAFDAAVTASRDRNDFAAATGRTLVVALGVVDPVTFAFTAVAPGAVPDAVKVTTTDTVDYFFRPGSGTTSRSAVGRAGSEDLAGFSVGSFALGLDSANSALLNGLIGDALGIGVLGYDGLATADVVLGDLALALDAGTVDELLTTQLTIGELSAALLTLIDPTQTLNLALLNQLATANLSALPLVAVGDLLSIGQGSEAALDTSVNVLDLIAGSAFVANGSSFLTVPGVAASLPFDTANVVTNLRIIEAPRTHFGPVGTGTSTSQVTLDLDLDLLNINLGVPLLGALASARVSLDLTSADADALIDAILCGDPLGLDVGVITALLQTALVVNVSVLGLRVRVSGASTEPPTGTLASFDVPPSVYGESVVETGAGSVGLAGLALSPQVTGTLGLLGFLLNPVLTAVTNVIVNPLIAALDASLLGPLTDLLGLNVAGADVGLLDIRCNANDIALVG